MDACTWQRRRRSFGVAAEEYERFRPDYPAEAIVWLVGPGRRRVLDVGAGTGKLTRALLVAGHEVVAVEPDDQMRALLSDAYPDVPALAGTAEALPVPRAAFDVVTAGQAFHWFDRTRALREIVRALTPSGVLAVVWNLRDESVPWVAELGRTLHGEDGTGASVAGESEDFGPLFGPVERAAFAHAHRMDVMGLVGLVASRSYTITLPEPRRLALLAEVEEIGRHEAASSSDGLVELPYVAACLRAGVDEEARVV